METIVLEFDESRTEYLREQILLLIIKMLELQFTPTEIIAEMIYRIHILKEEIK